MNLAAGDDDDEQRGVFPHALVRPFASDFTASLGLMSLCG